MNRILSIFLSAYLLLGFALLPKGDFSFTSQLSKLYDEFVQVNGSASFDEFLAEEFLEPFSLPEDDSAGEPFEKECHPVPIDLITFNANTSLYTVAAVIAVQPEPIPVKTYTPFTENLTRTDPDSVFHPPRRLPFLLA